MPLFQELALMTQYPKGFFALAAVLASLMLSFSFLQGITVLHLIQQFAFSSVAAYKLYAVYSGLVYLATIIGGLLTSRRWLGPIQCIYLGILLMLLAMLCLCFANVTVFYMVLLLFIFSYGVIYPNAFFLLGTLYENNLQQQQRGFTLAYISLNVGALTGYGFAGYATHNQHMLLTAIATIVIALCVLVLYHRHKALYQSRLSLDYSTQWIPTLLLLAITIVCAYFALIYAALIQNTLSVLCALSLFIFMGFVGHYWRAGNRRAAKQVMLLGVLICLTVLFWSYYHLEGNLIIYFFKYEVDRHLFGYQIAAPTIFMLNPIVILLFGFYLARYTPLLKTIMHDKSINKVYWGMLLMMLSFACLSCGGLIERPSSLVWALLFMFFFSVAELVLAPTTYAMVIEYTEKSVQPFFFGLSRAALGVSSFFSGSIASYVESTNFQQQEGPHAYSIAFLVIAASLLLVALIILGLRRTFLSSSNCD